MSPVTHFAQEWFRIGNAEGDIINFRGPLWITAHDGLGLVQSRAFTEAGPQQHGQTLAAAYLQARVVTLQIHAQTATEPALQVQRDAMALMFNRPNVEIFLDTMMPSGTARRLDCRYLNGYTAEGGEIIRAKVADAVQTVNTLRRRSSVRHQISDRAPTGGARQSPNLLSAVQECDQSALEWQLLRGREHQTARALTRVRGVQKRRCRYPADIS